MNSLSAITKFIGILAVAVFMFLGILYVLDVISWEAIQEDFGRIIAILAIIAVGSIAISLLSGPKKN